MVAKGIQTRAIDCESGVLPLSYHAPQKTTVVKMKIGLGRPKRRWLDKVGADLREKGLSGEDVYVHMIKHHGGIFIIHRPKMEKMKRKNSWANKIRK